MSGDGRYAAPPHDGPNGSPYDPPTGPIDDAPTGPIDDDATGPIDDDATGPIDDDAIGPIDDAPTGPIDDANGPSHRMAGKVTSRGIGRPSRSHLRMQAMAFRTVLLAFLVSALCGSLWLFLSNLDQLVPREPVAAEELHHWRSEPTPNGFAGSFWRRLDFWRSLNLTVVTATITMTLAALVGIPAAYGLSRHEVPGKRLLDTLLSSIIVLPSSSVGLCLIILFQHGWLRTLQDALDLHVVYTLQGIVVAQLVLSLAIGIRAWKAAFDGVNPRLEHVARSLGSSSWRSFWTVTLPCARSGILAGLILAWTRAAAEFGGVLIFCSTFAERPLSNFSPLIRSLGLHQADPLAVTMWSQIEYGNVEYGFAVAFVLVGISACTTYAIHRLGGGPVIR